MNGVTRIVGIVVAAATFILALWAVVLTFALTQKEPTAAPGIYPPPQNNISVTGEGKVSAEPDLAQVTIGVQTRAEQAGTAVTQNNETMEAVRAALTSLGVEDKDIQTVEFSVQPIIIYIQETGEQEIQGYTASNSILVKVRDLDQVGEVLDAATSAGANNFGSIAFAIEDPTAYLDEAREKALADAVRRAEQLAQATGVRLGDVMYVSDYSYVPVPASPFYYGKGGGGEEVAAEVPIAPGQLDLIVNVSLTYEIEQ